MGGIGEPQSGRPVKSGRVLYGADGLVTQWVARHIPGFQASLDAKALGVFDGKRIVAGVVFERWNGVHAEVSIAAEPGSRWADRGTLFRLFDYPFRQIDCLALTVVVPQSNLSSLNLATKLGFKPEAIIAFAAHDGGPLIVLKMFRDQCRWINDGQGWQSASTARSVQNGIGRGAVQSL